MSKDRLGTAAEAVLAIIIMFVFPCLWTVHTGQELVGASAMAKTDRFVSDICKKGYIDEQDLILYEGSLISLGLHPEVSITHNQIVYDPVLRDASGEPAKYPLTSSSEDIYRALEQKGAFLMQKGDWFSISIKYDKYSRYGLSSSLLPSKEITYSSTGTVYGIVMDEYSRYLGER